MFNFPEPTQQLIHYACTVVEQGIRYVVSVHQMTAREVEDIPCGEQELSEMHSRKVRFIKITPRQANRWYSKRQLDPKHVAPLATILMTPTLRIIK